MHPRTIERLHQAVSAVCPIVGLSIDDSRIDFDGSATESQKAAARNAMAAFDASDALTIAWIEDQYPERKGLRVAAQGAIDDNNTFISIASPTSAQVAAQVKRLSQQNNRIIRRLIQLD